MGFFFAADVIRGGRAALSGNHSAHSGAKNGRFGALGDTGWSIGRRGGRGTPK